MDIKDFENRHDWLKVWSGKWSFHSCSQFGEMWSVRPAIGGVPAYPYVVYIHRQTSSDCWVSQLDRDNFCHLLRSEIEQDENRAQSLADSLKSSTDNTLAFIKEHSEQKVDRLIYDNFWEHIAVYYLAHIYIKYIVDYLSPEQLEKYLPIFEEARVYAEPVFHEQELFMTIIAEQIAQSNKLATELILCTTKEELHSYFQKGILPAVALLQQRFELSAQFFSRGQRQEFIGAEAERAESILLPEPGEHLLKGQTAYPGQARGRVRIVRDPLHYQGDFVEGDILVTGMTRPEYLPFMRKSAGFITDAGGILSHAAITARELKKPCIIGTQTATKVLQDGDWVLMDADLGTVTRIN
jgi:phosphohistidine swiveling domain-containing protein